MVPEINLLPQSDKKNTSSTLVYTILIAVTAIALAYMIVLYFGAKSDLTTLSKEEQSVTVQRDGLQQKAAEATNLSAGSLAQSVKFVENVTYPVTPLITEIEQLLADHTFVREYEFNEDSMTVTIDFETVNAISTYVEKVGSSALFADQRVDTIDEMDVALGDQTNEKTNEEKLNEIPRYTAKIQLFIDYAYLAQGKDGLTQ